VPLPPDAVGLYLVAGAARDTQTGVALERGQKALEVVRPERDVSVELHDDFGQ
jgi:hypothetical protein